MGFDDNSRLSMANILVKLGDELHGPKDEMRINRDQVLLWENLKGDSKVTDAIKNHRK